MNNTASSRNFSLSTLFDAALLAEIVKMRINVVRLTQLKPLFIFATICQIYASVVAYIILLLRGDVSSGRERSDNAKMAFLAIDVIRLIIGILNMMSAQATAELLRMMQSDAPKEWSSIALPPDATVLGGCMCFDAIARISFEDAWTPSFSLVKVVVLLRACYMQGIYSKFRFMRIHLCPGRSNKVEEAALRDGNAVTNHLLLPLTGRAHALFTASLHRPEVVVNWPQALVFRERAHIFLLHVLSARESRRETRRRSKTSTLETQT